MDILEIIKQRRSIRKYKSNPINRELIMKIIEAGRWAPSGLNNQPWKFMLIEDDIRKNGLAKFTKYDSVIKSATCNICVFLDHNAMYNRDKDLMAIGAFIENMLLEAHSLGLGACWLGEIINNKDEVHKYLNIKSEWELMAVIALGYPDEESSLVDRKNINEILLSMTILFCWATII